MSPELMSIIKEANDADLQVYNYVLEKCFPRQLAAAGEDLDDRLRALRQRNADMTHAVKESWASQARRNCVYKPMLYLTS